ncbi:thioredoxin domain-containing protein [Chitinophaga sp. 212800010-3]|uniref:DsbA family protein n=1 Tax=unclassified Chitinophaga TaxID=2619133 RepID=UPI002DEB476A|nr:Thioredoxin domain-containing protein [Chitinophaga sp. 212800010-3]
MPNLIPPVNVLDHIWGSSDATIEVVEYGDFQCPYCQEAFFIVKKLWERFQGQLRFVFRNFPMSETHEYAMDAALAAESAGRQHKFWEMYEALFSRQADLNEELILKLAADLTLDLRQFSEDMEDPRLLSRVEADFESGVRSGVNSTPAFYLNGNRYNGDFHVLATILEP